MNSRPQVFFDIEAGGILIYNNKRKGPRKNRIRIIFRHRS